MAESGERSAGDASAWCERDCGVVQGECRVDQFIVRESGGIDVDYGADFHRLWPTAEVSGHSDDVSPPSKSIDADWFRLAHTSRFILVLKETFGRESLQTKSEHLFTGSKFISPDRTNESRYCASHHTDVSDFTEIGQEETCTWIEWRTGNGE